MNLDTQMSIQPNVSAMPGLRNGLQTYYLTYECKPLNGHVNAGHYSGAVADVFITAESEADVEERIEQHLQEAGWVVETMDYAELVTSASAHDARLGPLFRKAQAEGIAALFSPFR